LQTKNKYIRRENMGLFLLLLGIAILIVVTIKYYKESEYEHTPLKTSSKVVLYVLYFLIIGGVVGLIMAYFVIKKINRKREEYRSWKSEQENTYYRGRTKGDPDVELLEKTETEKKIDRLNDIWESAVKGNSPELGREAFSLLKEIIAEDPSNDAKTMLADCYYFGIGCDEDLSIAKQLYLEVANDPSHIESRHTYVFKVLGDMSYNEKDEAAFAYYTKFMQYNPNDSEVQRDIADCYYEGFGITQDVERALSMYKELSLTDYGNTIKFQVRYGEVLDEQRCEESINWFSKAANNNDAWATYCLANLLKKARYLPFDTYTYEYRIREALRLYRRASDIASDQNDTELASLSQDSYNLFEAELKANAFAFYYENEDGEGEAIRCRITE
jgi:TPR repeat protein